MTSRTIDDALTHAEQQRGYPLRESPHLITDFILLADEVQRLRSAVPVSLSGGSLQLEDARGPRLTDEVGKVTRN